MTLVELTMLFLKASVVVFAILAFLALISWSLLFIGIILFALYVILITPIEIALKIIYLATFTKYKHPYDGSYTPALNHLWYQISGKHPVEM